MARKYTVQSGLTSIAASTTKVACQLASTTTTDATAIGFDVSFDSTATGAAAAPAKVELVRTTGASSGGATFTPTKWNKARAASAATARINDTTDGASPTVLMAWEVPLTTGLAYQFPLGRELELDVSDFLELRITTPTGITTCNYEANLHFEE